MPFLSEQKIGGHLGPLPRSFFPMSSDQNSEIAILFSIVEKRRRLTPPQSPWEGAASCKFAYSNGYWEMYKRFQGDFLVGRRG